MRPPLSRLFLGGACFTVAQTLPLFIPLVLTSDRRSDANTVLSGSMLFGLPEIGSFIAVSILGKLGYDWLKWKTFDLVKSSAPAAEVGPTRYYTGLLIFCILLSLGIVEPYISDFLPRFLQENRRLYMNIADACFVANLLVLGGDFWDKRRALFVFEAKVRFP